MPSLARATRFFVVVLLLAAGIIAGWWLQRTPEPAADDTPSCIILLSMDTVRADHLSLYGYARPTTPQLAALAAEAVTFTRVLSPAPATAPAHMSMLTGVSPAVHGVYNYGGGAVRRVAPSLPLLTTLLRQHGYRTEALVSSPNVGAELGFATGCDGFSEDFFACGRLYDDAGRTEREEEQRLRDLLTRGGREEKLFLFLHHYFCHRVYLAPPAAYRERFAAALLPGLPRSIADVRRQGTGNDDHDFFSRFDGGTAAQREHVVALYDGTLAYADHVAGMLVRLLHETGRYDRTLLVVTADHGEEFMEHGSWGHDQLYREHLDVPLLVKLPGQRAGGRRYEIPVSTLALAPTILAAAGLPVPAHMQGQVLPPLADSPAARPLVAYQNSGDEQGRDVVTGMRVEDGGYAWYWHNGDSTSARLHLLTDTMEQHDLAGVRPEIAARMRTQAAALLEEDRACRAQLEAALSGEE